MHSNTLRAPCPPTPPSTPHNPADVLYVQAISQPDAKGNLPAHIGAVCSADEAVLRILLKAYPAALDKSNGEGKVLAVLAQA